MSRLVIFAALLALVGAAAYLAWMAVLSVVRLGRDGSGDRGPEGAIVQRISYILLVALIVYAAVWGAG